MSPPNSAAFLLDLKGQFLPEDEDREVLVPGYDSQGKLWTVQYIKADGAKRFAKDSRKHGCFHVVGAPNSAAALQKIAVSPVVVIAEGYATAATIAEQPNTCVLAAFDSGNLLAVATALREQHKDKLIVIAGDDDHRLETNPGRTKALEAAGAVKGMAIFPQLSAEQKERGMTDFNDLASQNPEIVASQFQGILARTVRQGSESEMSVNIEKEVLRTMLSHSSRTNGREVCASRHIVKRNHAQSFELDRDL
jgi:putative DNA primase/helicase